MQLRIVDPPALYNPTPSVWESWNAQQQSQHQPRIVPPELRASYARGCTLRDFYNDCESGRWEPLGRKVKRSRGTIQKEHQALNRLDRYTQPADWQGDWPGPSLEMLGSVSNPWWDQLWAEMLRGGLAGATVASTRNHIGVLLNHAVAVKALDRCQLGRPVKKRPPRTRVYTPPEVQTIWEALDRDPDLRGAFWLALHIGCRPVDLFLVRWSDFVTDARGRRLVEFEARKTSKLQAVPVLDHVWQVLDALPRRGDWVFPDLGNANCRDSEKSAQARLRNARMKLLMARVGIEVDHPWQTCRATCNERLESHRPGVGAFVLGHSLAGVNAQNYRSPTEAVWSALETLPPYVLIEP